ncbi:RICIN domain-containing protein [Streptosporangiaceae bacterium NEAU-GS5]|nr:RICIN domain-containing protein [Streptosporangiaceae bacterium NEAU-GS5]
MRRLLTAAAIVALAVFPLPAQAAPVTFTSTAVANAAGLCMDVPGGSSANNVQLTQAACSGGAGQSYTFTPVSGTTDTYTIGTLTAGKCVDVFNVSTADNAAIIQWTCNTGANQRFRLIAAGSNFQLMATHSSKCIAAGGDSTAAGTGLVQLPCTSARVWRIPGFNPGTGTTFQGLPSVDPNACHNAGLPRSYGTNFPTPRDPFAQGFFNQSALGWDGNYWPVFTYLSGSFFARGVPVSSTIGGTAYCGAMYSFSAYGFGGNPAAQSVQWTMDNGYLPALKTTRTSGNVTISIKDFANRVVIGGNPFVLMYARVSVTNNGTSAVSVPPGGSGPNLLRLTPTSLDTVQPGATNNHDFVVAVDAFGTGATLPTGTALQNGAPSYDTSYNQMAAYWNSRVAETVNLTLPNLTLPNTGSLANPGTALINAFKAGTIYNLMVQVGKNEFSGANNYAWLLNHDVPGELEAKFATGDFHDAQNLLLTARISEASNFNEVGANWYWDGVWKTMGTWALYLAKTNDTAFVNQFFNDTGGTWGPSLRTIARTNFPAQLDTDGTLRSNFDNDSTGRWLFSNYSALEMLAAYKYIATRLGQTAEATWAQGAYTSLHNALNTVIGNNQAANGFDFLPCEVHRPNTANRCNTFNDANWASPGWVGQNQWSTMLMGGTLSGIVGDPGQIDRMYQWGFNRLSANGLPFPTFGAFNGYSTAYNTSYSSDGLYSTQYRDLPITSYAWQIRTTTGGPNAWWEANGSGPSTSNPWIGSHAGPQFGACPYAWPISGQQLGLLHSVVAEGLTAAGSGPYTFTRPLYIGRGIPNTWIAAGQTIAASNLTSSYDITSGARSTYGVSIAVTRPASQRIVTVSITGTPPGGTVRIQLPIFASVGVTGVTGGTFANGTVTASSSSASTVTITLAS